MNIEYGYIQTMKEILNKVNNSKMRVDRTGKGTYAIFGAHLRHDMSLGFPLLTTKKVHFKSIVSELLWFMRGQTDLRTLLLDDSKIWVGDAYKNYLRIKELDNSVAPLTREEFIEQIMTNDEFNEFFGQLGAIYGAQWRGVSNNTSLKRYLLDDCELYVGQLPQVDQLQNCVDDLKDNWTSRRILVSAWNVSLIDNMVLPPCHISFQFFKEELSAQEKKRLKTDKNYKLSLSWYQRSCDFFLGGAFNIASYALLLELIAKLTDSVCGEIVWNIGDTHLYSDHIEQAKIQVSRTPMDLPKLKLSDKINFDGTVDDMLKSIIKNANNDYSDFISLDNYVSHSAISAPLSN